MVVSARFTINPKNVLNKHKSAKPKGFARGEKKSMKYHVRVNDMTYTYNNPYDMYNLLESIAGHRQAEEACSWAELANWEETYSGSGFTVSMSDN